MQGCFAEFTLIPPQWENGLSMTALRLRAWRRSGNGLLAKPFVEIKG